MGREKWGEKSGARKVERRKVGREKFRSTFLTTLFAPYVSRPTFLAPLFPSHFSRGARKVEREKWSGGKWDEKSGARKVERRKVGREKLGRQMWDKKNGATKVGCEK